MLKKRLTAFIFAALLIVCAFSLSACKEEKGVTTIKVSEVTHSVFYAPSYCAMQLGYFAEEGLQIELTNAGGADAVMSAVLSGSADIGLCGPEATIYVYNQGAKDYVINFAQLTQCDGSFLLSRNPDENFTIDKLKGAHIIGGRKGGMPVNVLEWILKENGLTPGVDVTVDTSIAFNAMSGAFIGGTGDYVSLFEPTASNIEKQGYGYIVMSLGAESGNIPYTVYNAKKSYIENNGEIVKAFARAIEKGQKYVEEHSSEEIAKTIISFFPDTTLSDITNAVENYKKINAYATDINMSKESFDLLQDIIEYAGELDKRVDYSELVITDVTK